jgi:hypothetical protein
MEELLDSVATLPETAKRRIISQAEGIPLYAIETVRALVDRGALVERDGALVLIGELGELDVPPSLISLLGARLDALAPDEREMVRTMSVFGGNFPLAAAEALSELPAPIADAVLRSLVRKQVLAVRSDPLSPDRGQYRFAQMLLRTVAYDTLSKRERKTRHLAAAHYLSRTFANEGEDVAEVSPTKARTWRRSWLRTTSRPIAARPTTRTRSPCGPRRSRRSAGARSAPPRSARRRPPSARTARRSTLRSMKTSGSS